jgi:mannose-6-phosphate isomerase-like protein (cupin superfamily)
MKMSRRELAILFSSLAGRKLSAQSPALPSKTYAFADLAVHANGRNLSRPVLNGATHTGLPIELHMTELAPGEAPHPPHHHVHEEMVILHQGNLEVTIMGESVNLGPGSVAYVASGEQHGWRNVGTTQAQYYVLALGRDDAK